MRRSPRRVATSIHGLQHSTAAVFRTSALEFQPEGTLVVQTVLEGIGEVQATGTSKSRSAIEWNPTFRHIASSDIAAPITATPALSRGAMFVRTGNSVIAVGRKP